MPYLIAIDSDGTLRHSDGSISTRTKKIIEKLVSKKESEDSNLLYKALISLRNEKNIKFQDTDMKEKYEKYIKQYK